MKALRQPVDLIHSVFKTASAGGAEGGTEGVIGSIRACSYKSIHELLGIRGNMLVDLGAGDGRMTLAGIAYGASRAVGYELPGNISRKLVFDAAKIILKNRFPVLPWYNTEWIGENIDKVIALLIGQFTTILIVRRLGI